MTGRTKTVASFAEKARRTKDGVPLYTDPLREITDQIGVRVITYVHSDVAAVADLLHDQVVVHDDRDMGRETAQRGPLRLRQPAPADRRWTRHVTGTRRTRSCVGRMAQVQVRTVLQHAWAEFEHDIRYKGTVPDEHASEFDRRFTLAAGPAGAGRPGVLRDPRHACARRRQARPTARPSPTTTRGSTRGSWRRSWPGSTPTPAGRAPTTTPGSPACCSSWGSPRLDELGRRAARAGDERPDPARMDYRYPPGAVRRLDDALLAAHGTAYVDLRGNAHRRAALEARLERLSGDELG